MITEVFETTKFRVQISGSIAYVEARNGKRWIFRDQFKLPIPLDSLAGRRGTPVLSAAVRHFEASHPNDPSLRNALVNTHPEEPVVGERWGALPSRV